jgi:hypothetical protein
MRQIEAGGARPRLLGPRIDRSSKNFEIEIAVVNLPR